jgi:ABC-type transport system involved in multi-copper enzyme maturation permease subunit
MSPFLLFAGAVSGSDEAPQNLGVQEWQIISTTLVFLGAAFCTFAFSNKTGIIARATAKEAVRQPIFLLSLAVVIMLLVLNTFLPFFTLGEDVKMLKDCGLATLLISSMLIAIWTASSSIADEIEGKTAMTLLSKPINRRQFILGKYLGIMHAVLLYLIPVGIAFLALVYYKVSYDARESSKDAPTVAQCLIVVVQTIPGLILMFFEVALMAAVSVAISTRLPMVVNLTTCLAIFVVGHLTPLLVQSGEGKIEVVPFFGRLIATILPMLDHFNMSAAIATDAVVPVQYLLTSAVYCVCYCSAMILLAFILFEDRDLA